MKEWLSREIDFMDDDFGDRKPKRRKSKFIESVFEIAFGDNAIKRGYTQKEVLEKLREFSDLALKN